MTRAHLGANDYKIILNMNSSNSRYNLCKRLRSGLLESNNANILLYDGENTIRLLFETRCLHFDIINKAIYFYHCLFESPTAGIANLSITHYLKNLNRNECWMKVVHLKCCLMVYVMNKDSLFIVHKNLIVCYFVQWISLYFHRTAPLACVQVGCL